MALVSSTTANDAAADTPVGRVAASGVVAVAAGVARPVEAILGDEHEVVAGASATIARQVLDGAPFDAVVLADSGWMDLLAREDLIDAGTRRTLGTHRLVLVVPGSDSGDDPRLPVDRLAMADPQAAPLGDASGQVMAALGGVERFGRDIVQASDARAVAALVASGAVDAGIVYATDADDDRGLRVVRRFDPTLHDPVIVEAAALRGRPSGFEVVDRLVSFEARDLFAGSGLDVDAVAVSSSGGAGAAAFEATLRTDWWRPVAISLRVAAVAVIVMLPPGVAIAWWLARSRSRWTGVVEAVVDLPLVLPPVVVGYLLLRMMGRGGAIGGFLHEHLGIDLAFTWWAAAIASGVMGFPLLVRSARPAIASVDRDLERAAANAGAGRWRTFRKVTLPLAAPGIIAGGTLAFARSLGEFGATVLVAGNLPGETRTLALAIWSETRIPGREAQVVGLVLVAVGLSITATFVSEWLTRRARSTREP